MSPRKDAESFIKDQIGIMSKYGNAPKLSAKRYEEVVTETQRSLESLRRQPTKTKAKAAVKK